jgi:hypothetical protein
MTGCSKDEGVQPQDDGMLTERGFTINGIGTGLIFYTLSDNNEIVRYKAGPPAKLVSSAVILGLGATERILSIDFRPSNGRLYGVSDSSMIYLIDPVSGQAKLISRGPFEPVIKGATVGFDFDPMADRIRLVTDQAQNLRINPDDGTVDSVGLDLNPAGVAINSIAYSRAFTPSRTFPLYDIDATNGILYKQDPQNDGTLTMVGPLGLVITGEGGFDIAGQNGVPTFFQAVPNIGFAVLYGHSLNPVLVSGDDLSTDASRVWEINLLNGKTTYKGKFDRNIIGIAIP